MHSPHPSLVTVMSLELTTAFTVQSLHFGSKDSLACVSATAPCRLPCRVDHLASLERCLAPQSGRCSSHQFHSICRFLPALHSLIRRNDDPLLVESKESTRDIDSLETSSMELPPTFYHMQCTLSLGAVMDSARPPPRRREFITQEPTPRHQERGAEDSPRRGCDD